MWLIKSDSKLSYHFEMEKGNSPLVDPYYRYRRPDTWPFTLVARSDMLFTLVARSDMLAGYYPPPAPSVSRRCLILVLELRAICCGG